MIAEPPAPDFDTLIAELAQLDGEIARLATAQERASAAQDAALASGDGKALARAYAAGAADAQALDALQARRVALDALATPLRTARAVEAASAGRAALAAEVERAVDALADALAPALAAFQQAGTTEQIRLLALAAQLRPLADALPRDDREDHGLELARIVQPIHTLGATALSVARTRAAALAGAAIAPDPTPAPPAGFYPTTVADALRGATPR